MGISDPFDWDRLVSVTNLAPSVLNTRPWRFERAAEDRVNMRPDWNRHLKVIDPSHRELFISCGAALFNLRLAIRVAGHDPVIWLLPDARPVTGPPCEHCGTHCGTGDLLASAEIVTKRTHPATIMEQRMYEAIPVRRTTREPFERKLPMNVLAELEQAARREGVTARMLFPPATRRLLRQASATAEDLRRDTAYLAELSHWTGDMPGELGVPAESFGPMPRNGGRSPVRDLGMSWHGERETAKFERHPQFIALQTLTNKPADWLRLGQALQRLLLTATWYGADASFLTQSLEAEDRISRQEPARMWPWRNTTQMIVRVGQHVPGPGPLVIQGEDESR